jgi:hypothetical protein
MHPMLQAISYHRISKAFKVSCPILYQREWRAELRDFAGSFTCNHKLLQLSRSEKKMVLEPNKSNRKNMNVLNSCFVSSY